VRPRGDYPGASNSCISIWPLWSTLKKQRKERLRQKKGTGANILAGFRRWSEPTRRAKNLIAPTSYGISIDWRLNIAHEKPPAD